ncbi:MAG: magnesium transporter [Sulfolobales archaeon]|nr:magnesium transporter [Sulfolobales archaeon]MCX8208285.1 magnesium transporter [Sulfolobales archaeon]MDW8010123.1 magnesium transporter [Sulfolobales archaeon]
MGSSVNSVEAYYAKIRELIESGRIEEAGELFDSLDPPYAHAVVIRLNSDERYKLFTKTTLASLAEVLAKLPDEIVYEIVIVKGLDEVSKIITTLPLDEAADVLGKLPPRYRNKVVEVMSRETAEEVSKILKYHPESVGGVMTPQVPVFNWNMKVGDAISTYVSRDRLGLYDRHHYIYVVDDDYKLVGWIDVKSFLTKPKDSALKVYAQKPPVVVEATKDREHAAKLAVDYDLLEVPVVDQAGKFLGAVTLDDVLDVLVTEYSEDLLKFGGFIEAVRGGYMTLSPLKLALKRVPMILYLYLMNSITGSIVASFTSTIERLAILAAFLPMLADNSGNIGAQSSTLILRGMALGEIRLSKTDVFRVLLKELLVSSLMILIMGPVAFAIAFGVVWFATASLGVSLRVALIVVAALITSCYVSDVVGSFLPILLARLGVDPAVASAPLITTVGDIVTAFTYFWIATGLLAVV